MNMPIRGEQPQINWPQITIGEHLLVVRWTFYVTWMLSTRKVDMLKLREMGKNLDPGMIATMLEVFAACVAENFPAGHAPDPEFWARAISATNNPALFSEANTAILEAVGKAPKVALPATPPPEMEQPVTRQ